MKVLFAFNNEKSVNQMVEFYKEHYGEKLEATKVFFFRALIDTLRKNKNFDRIVIHEDLEPTGSKNQDAIDKYLFNNLDKVTDEAGRADIIIVCTERRQQNDKFVKRLFNLGIYNVLTGQDRTVGKVTELINRPRTKKEAKLFVDADLEENPYEVGNKVDELELRNIVKYYEQNIFNREKIVAGFESLYGQYTFENLKQIVPFLPIKAREVLEQESQKYIALMNYKPPKGGKHEQVRVVEVPVYIQQEPPVQKEMPKVEPIIEEPVPEAPKARARAVEPELPKVEPAIEEPIPEPPKVKAREVEPELPKVESVIEEPMPEPPKVKAREVEPELPKVESVVEEPIPAPSKVKAREVELELPKVEPVIEEPMPATPKVEIEQVVESKPPKTETKVIEPELPKVEPQVIRPKVEESVYGTKNIEVEPPRPKIPRVETREVEPEIRKPAYTAPPKYQPPRPTVDENRIQTVTQVIEKEVIKPVYETPRDYKKVVCFVGAHKAGTTFMINAVASMLTSKGVKVAILDLTNNKDTYMIYTNRDIDQRDVAGNSLNNLSIGQNRPFVLGNLSLYTGIPRTNRSKLDIYKAIEIAKRDNSVVLIDCDFSTKKDLPDVFRFVQTIYVVQDMDTLNILPITMFLKELKNADVDNTKISVIINKYIKSVLKVDDILGALMNYTSPDLSVMEEDLLPKRVSRFIVPFDEQNYLRYIESIYTCKMNFAGFSEDFKHAISIIIQDIFPIGTGGGSRPVEKGGFMKDIFKKK